MIFEIDKSFPQLVNVNKHPYLTKALPKKLKKYYLESPFALEYFDRDGFELCELEKAFYKANNIPLSNELNHCSYSSPWIKMKEGYKNYRIIIDHSFISMRFGFEGDAKEQLLEFVDKNPLIRRMLAIVPKYGLDFSIDYVGSDRCMEILHVERDYHNVLFYNKTKGLLEEAILGRDWDKAVDLIKKTEVEWHELNSDDQSDFKARLLGFNRTYHTVKIY